MTVAEAVALFDALDMDTRNLVVAVFGCVPDLAEPLSPADAERLGEVIAAVQRGRQAATDAAAAAQPETVAEATAPTLPDPPPADVDPLRARIRAMDDAARNLFLERWTSSGLPALADAAGVSAVLPIAQHHAIEQLIADHEPPAPDGLHASLMSRLGDLPVGARFVVDARLSQQSERDYSHALDCTIGRAATFATILDTVESEAEQVVAAALGPVADPVGEVITTPVADGAALADALPAKAKVAEVLAWVGADPGRARFALNAEQTRSKPRDGVVSKLSPIAGVSAEAPPLASAPPVPAEEVTAPATPAAAPTSSASIEGQATIEQACAEALPIVDRLRRAAATLLDIANDLDPETLAVVYVP